jgi:O-antigen ligase
VKPRSALARAVLVLCLAIAATTSAIAIANILLGVTTLAWFFRLRRERRWREAFASPIAFALALFVLLLAASAVFSLHPGRSAVALKGIFTFLLLPLFSDTLERREDLAALCNVLAAAALLLAGIGFWQYLHGSNQLSDRIEATLSHYMTFSGLLLLVCLLFLGRALEDPSVRWVAWLVTLSLGTVVLLTFTRNAYVGLVAAIVTFLAIRRPRWLWSVVPVGAIVYVCSPSGIRLRLLSTFDPSDPTNRDRLDMARAGVRMIRDFPVFGLGLTLIKPYYPLYRVPNSLRFRVPHLHNNALQIAAESGLFAASAYLAILGCFFFAAFRRLRVEGDSRARGILAGSFLAITGISVAGLFEYNFGDVEVLMTTLLIMSIPFSRAVTQSNANVSG